MWNRITMLGCLFVLISSTVIPLTPAGAQGFPPNPMVVKDPAQLLAYQAKKPGGHYLPIHHLVQPRPLPARLAAVYPLAADTFNNEDALLRFLQDKDSRVRATTAMLLGTSRTTDRQQALLLAMLRDRNPDIRMSAVLGVSAHRSPANRQHLLAMLTDREARVRIAALVEVARYAHPDEVAVFRRALMEDRDLRVRQTAAAALGRYDAEPAIAALAAAVQETNLALRFAVISALAPLLPSRALPQSREEEERWWRRETLATRARHVPYRKQEIDVIGRLLRTEVDPAVRLEAVYALRRSHREAAVHALLRAISDEHAEVRAAAAAALGESHDPDAVLPLTALLADETDIFGIDSRSGIGPYQVCDIAAKALGEVGDRRAIPAFIAALTRKHRSLFLTGCITDALCEITGEQMDDAQSWIDWWRAQPQQR